MRWIPLPLALSFALGTTASLAADAPLRPEKMRQAMALKLGLWKTTTQVVDFEIEPVPGNDQAEAERVAAYFRPLLAGKGTGYYCLRDEPDRLYLPGLQAPPDCDYSRTEARNGRFAVAGLCTRPDSDRKVEVAVEGTYAPEFITFRSEATSSSKRVRFRYTIETESRFFGRCEDVPAVRPLPLKGD